MNGIKNKLVQGLSWRAFHCVLFSHSESQLTQ
jgi:hypothetical protein